MMFLKDSVLLGMEDQKDDFSLILYSCFFQLNISGSMQFYNFFLKSNTNTEQSPAVSIKKSNKMIEFRTRLPDNIATRSKSLLTFPQKKLC